MLHDNLTVKVNVVTSWFVFHSLIDEVEMKILDSESESLSAAVHCFPSCVSE